MVKTMERLVEKLSLDNKPAIRDQTELQHRNPNFRRLPVTQIRQRDQRNQGDQQIKPPFQNNYVDENFEESLEDNIHCCDDVETYVFLTKEEHDKFMDENDKFMQENDDMLSMETKEYKKGYQNAIMQFQKQYNLRNKKVLANPQKGNPTKEPQANLPSSSQPKKDSSAKDALEKGKQKEEPPKKVPETKRDAVIKEVEKTQSPFNFESEMEKIKIYVPFNELIRNVEYRSQIIKMLKMEEASDTLNVQDDHPAILFGPRVEECGDDGDVPPFYVSLKVHDMTLHNAMLDSGASHNLMPKVIMDELGLDITRPYKDLFSFDSRKVKCLGLIKDLVVSLSQIPSKNLVMDVVVVDIPPKFGMLLSRSWAAKLKGTLQMDMSYATIPVFGQERRLYREVLLKYMVSSKRKPNNHPIYSIDTEVGSSIFYNDLCFEEEDPKTLELPVKDEEDQQAGKISDQQNNEDEEMWNMNFDGAASKEGVGAGVWIIPPKSGSNICSYKFSFDCTNNMAEYEALILGLNTLKDLGEKRIVVHGDFELVINQVKGIYQSKHPRMRAYINIVLDVLESFTEYNLSVIPRGQNLIVDALATSASVFKIPIFPNIKYEIEVKHRPTVPDNIKYWNIFEDDKQVVRFLQMTDEFSNTNIDEENCFDQEEDADMFSNEDCFLNQIVGRDIVQLKNNVIPKGLVPLENLFDNNDVARNPKVTPNDEEIEDCNIGTQEKPKIIKLSKTLSP
jgi:ribonuclease HI